MKNTPPLHHPNFHTPPPSPRSKSTALIMVLHRTYAIPLFSLSDCFFLNQQVLEPTRKSNILDLIFSPDDFVNSIDVTDSLLSDHRIITVKTSIPFCHTPHRSMNRSCNAFESLDFKKADWSGLCSSIKLVNWQVKLHDCIASDCLSVITTTTPPP